MAMVPSSSALTEASLPPASPSPRLPPSHSQNGVRAPPIITTSSVIELGEPMAIQESDYPKGIVARPVKFTDSSFAVLHAAEVIRQINSSIGGDIMQRRQGLHEVGDKIGSRTAVSIAAGIPYGDAVDL